MTKTITLTLLLLLGGAFGQTTGKKTSELTARALVAGDKVIVTTVAGANAAGNVGDDVIALQTEDARTDNPHAVTTTQLSLENVDNTSDANKPISTAAQAAFDTYNVADVSSLAALTPTNGVTVITQGYYAANDGGGNVYTYDSASSATCDGGFIVDGVGGSNTPGLTAATYAGTGTGRFIAVDQTAARAKRFGAKGDGASDDTYRIQAWLNIGGALILETGVYRCQGLTSNLDVNVLGGEGAVLRLTDSSATSLLVLGGVGSKQSFTGIEFDGAYSQAAAGNWEPTVNADNIAIESLAFRDCKFANVVKSINIYGVTGKITITGCRFEGGKAHTGVLNEGTIFLVLRGKTTADEQIATVSNNVFVGTPGSQIGGCLITRDTGASIIQGIQAHVEANRFYDCGQNIAGNAVAAIVLYRGSPYSKASNNNIFGGTEKGIDIQGSSSPMVTGNYIQGVASNGIDLAPRDGDKTVSNGIISGNTLESIGGTAISVSGLSVALPGENVTISDNIVKGCARYILVADMIGHCSATDNTLSGSTETAVTQDLQCVSVIGSKQSGVQAVDLDLTFTGNNISTSSTTLRVDEVSGSVIIANNSFSTNAVSRAINVINCTGIVSVQGNQIKDNVGSMLFQLATGPIMVRGNVMNGITAIRGITFDTVTGVTSVNGNHFLSCLNDLVAYDAATGVNQFSDNLADIAGTLRKVNGSAITGAADNISITP